LFWRWGVSLSLSLSLWTQGLTLVRWVFLLLEPLHQPEMGVLLNYLPGTWAMGAQFLDRYFLNEGLYCSIVLYFFWRNTCNYICLFNKCTIFHCLIFQSTNDTHFGCFQILLFINSVIVSIHFVISHLIYLLKVNYWRYN
jgi:hypothetical protein